MRGGEAEGEGPVLAARGGSGGGGAGWKCPLLSIFFFWSFLGLHLPHGSSQARG